MAIKGKAYVKTFWSFQERPVASAKLNQWDDRIENALEHIHYLLSLAWGGDNGVLRGTGNGELQVVATNPPSMRVRVLPGCAFITRTPFRLREPVDTPTVVAPLQLPRVDLVQASLENWDIHVKTGAEAATPIAPTPDTDCLPLARLFLRPGTTIITQEDNGTHGYIVDTRAFV